MREGLPARLVFQSQSARTEPPRLLELAGRGRADALHVQ